jgi:DNA-binding CsgD family transcriptional regulator
VSKGSARHNWVFSLMVSVAGSSKFVTNGTWRQCERGSGPYPPDTLARKNMTIRSLVDYTRRTGFADLQAGLVDYASHVDELPSPEKVLNELHAVTTRSLPLPVLGAVRLPIKSGDWEAVRLGKSAFLHDSVPAGWWEEYDVLARDRFRPVLFLAGFSMASHTWTEVRRLMQPIGVDKWAYELNLKYGMRDGLTCPVGGRWVVGFWSRKELSNVLTQPMRILIFAAASFTALRLEQLVDLDPDRFGPRSQLTPRELAVLRLASTGAQSSEVATALDIGAETVRSHLKKAQTKLGARNRTQAVAEALRQKLIP